MGGKAFNAYDEATIPREGLKVKIYASRHGRLDTICEVPFPVSHAVQYRVWLNNHPMPSSSFRPDAFAELISQLWRGHGSCFSSFREGFLHDVFCCKVDCHVELVLGLLSSLGHCWISLGNLRLVPVKGKFLAWIGKVTYGLLTIMKEYM